MKKIEIWIFMLAIVLVAFLSVGCDILKKDNSNNIDKLMDYAEKKYNKEFEIISKQIGEKDFLKGRSSDILLLHAKDKDKFPFILQYKNNEIIDYYPNANAGYIIAKNLIKRCSEGNEEVVVNGNGYVVANDIDKIENVQQIKSIVDNEVFVTLVVSKSEEIELSEIKEISVEAYNYLKTVSDNFSLLIVFGDSGNDEKIEDIIQSTEALNFTESRFKGLIDYSVRLVSMYDLPDPNFNEFDKYIQKIKQD